MKAQINSIDSIREYAKSEGLKYIEITGAHNGYPEPLTGFGITGFHSFEDCERFASKFDADIYEFSQRNGWDLWNIEGARYNQFTLEELAEDYENVIFSSDELEDTVVYNEDTLSPDVRSEILKYLAMPDTAVVLTWYNDQYHVRTTIEAGMSYEYDSKRFAIGVYFSFSDFATDSE
jgi:hypothetical protein